MASLPRLLRLNRFGAPYRLSSSKIRRDHRLLVVITGVSWEIPNICRFNGVVISSFTVQAITGQFRVRHGEEGNILAGRVKVRRRSVGFPGRMIVKAAFGADKSWKKRY